MDEYNLKVSEEQLKIIMDSLDLYSRLNMGQFNELTKKVHLTGENEFTRFSDSSLANKINELKTKFFAELTPNGYYGIAHEKVRRSAKIACDLFMAMRHFKSYEEYHSRENLHTSVIFNTPLDISGSLKDFKIEKMEVL